MADLPLVLELPQSLTAVDAFVRWRALPGLVFLDSALAHPTLGRYSFVAADPYRTVRIPAPGKTVSPAAAARALAQCRAVFPETFAPAVAGLPPFQGGLVGFLAYDFGRLLENWPQPQRDEFEIPVAALGLYDVVCAFDQEAGRGWLISQGYPATTTSERIARARARLESFHDLLKSQPPKPRPRTATPLDATHLAPQYPAAELPGLTSNFRRDQYLAAVARAVEYIHAGDVFQVNIAQRLLYPAQGDSPALYLRLRERNPATFACYLDLGEHQVISASPERLVSVRHGRVETRPIKGTRQRSARPEADLFAADDLRASAKDRAENVMIVDLMRNDLSRICVDESVRVAQLCGVEQYQFVQHLVSVVEGRLRDEIAPLDVLCAVFPGGSITGAPKVRAMEIIAELEPTARGAYCGSLGYVGFDGSMDWNILIRTITAARGWWQLPAGGGIVAQSDPVQEYAETWHKALGMVKSLQ